MASIPACHAGDRGSIPRDGVFLFDEHITPSTFLEQIDYKIYTTVSIIEVL